MRYVFEDYTLDTDRRELRRGTGLIAVEPQVFDLLVYLVRNRERVVSRDDLIDAVWHGRIVSESTLNTRIYAVRSAIGDSGKDQRLVKTWLRKGVRFIGTTREELEPPANEPISTILQSGENNQPGHRRRLTVMACVLSDDTGRSIRLDPEERHGILTAFRLSLNDVCARLSGVAGPMVGDMAYFYFGYPAAHEHDAENAIRAGLAVLDAVPHLGVSKRIRLGPHVGIASGDVVVTNLPGNQPGHEPAIIGEAPELAAQLATAAETGTLLVAATTRSLARDLFDYHVSPASGRGHTGAFRVLGETKLGSRFDALHARGLTPLVGRREEISRMLSRWRRAKAGMGQIVLISGEPGIGKSRLIRELRDQIRVQSHAYMALSCAPHQKDTPYHPFVRFLEREAAILREDQAPVRLSKLEALLSQALIGPEATVLLANLLSIETQDCYAPLALTPRQRRQRTITILVQQILALADRTPLLLAFEDVHWIDPTSCEVLDLLANSIANLPVLLVITFRPEFAAPWISHPIATTIVLNRLDQRAASRLVEQLGGTAIPEHLRAGVVERADGVPLFLEELTKSVLEDGAEGGSLPASLHDLLMERLDRLSPAAKRAAQIGAAIGRSFSHELLAAIAALPDATLFDALNELLTSALLMRTGDSTDATYGFKHALVQAAAYGSMLRSVRAAIHGELAEELQLQDPGIAEANPDLLAFHFEHAGLIEQATSCYANAGWQALDRAAFSEALEQFNNALRMAALLPGTEARNLAELSAVQGLGFSLGRSAGYASTPYGAASERALLLCERLGYPPEYVGANFRYGDFQLSRGNLKAALDSATRLSEWGEARGDIRARVIGRTNAGRALLARGELAAARCQLEEAYELYQANRDDQSAVWSLRVALTRPVLLSHLLGNLAVVICWMGSPEKALALLATADQPHQPEVEATVVAKPLVQWYRLLVLSFLIEPLDLAGPAQELAAVSDEQGLPTFVAWATAIRGYAMAGRGNPQGGRALIAEGLRGYLATEAELWSSYFRILLADAQITAGEPDAALDILAEALEKNRQTGERWCDAEVYRQMGEALRKHKDDGEAEKCFRRAIDIADTAGMKLWKLTAASSYARLLCDRGEHEGARALLSPIYCSFSEGIQTAPLRRARILFAESPFRNS